MKRVPSSSQEGILQVYYSPTSSTFYDIFSGRGSVTDCSTDEDTFGRVVDRRFALLSKHAEDSMWRGFPRVWRRGASTVSTEGPKGGEIFKKCQYGEEGTTMRRVAPRHRLKNEPTPLNLLS